MNTFVTLDGLEGRYCAGEPGNRMVAEWRTADSVPKTKYLIKKARFVMLGGYAAIWIRFEPEHTE